MKLENKFQSWPLSLHTWLCIEPRRCFFRKKSMNLLSPTWGWYSLLSVEISSCFPFHFLESTYASCDSYPNGSSSQSAVLLMLCQNVRSCPVLIYDSSVWDGLANSKHQTSKLYLLFVSLGQVHQQQLYTSVSPMGHHHLPEHKTHGRKGGCSVTSFLVMLTYSYPANIASSHWWRHHVVCLTYTYCYLGFVKICETHLISHTHL